MTIALHDFLKILTHLNYIYLTTPIQSSNKQPQYLFTSLEIYLALQLFFFFLKFFFSNKHLKDILNYQLNLT